MPTGDCAGFGKQPKATARRLLTRVLWVGGLAVTGSVLGAASANAAEADQVDEPSGDLLGSLTSTIDPVTELVTETDTLLVDELALNENLLGESEFSGMVGKPIEELVGTVGLGEKEPEFAPDELAGERDAAIAAHTDRSMRRTTPDEATTDGDAGVQKAGGDGVTEAGLTSLIGSVDRLLTKDFVPSVASATGEFTSAITADVLDETEPAGNSPSQSTFSTQAITDPFGTLAGLVTLLDLPFSGGARVLEPVAPLLAPLDPVMGTAMPLAEAAGPLAGQGWQQTGTLVSATPFAFVKTFNTSADAAPRFSLDESGAARPAGQGGDSAVIHSSLDAGADGHHPSDGTRGGLRPSLLITPVAGLTALHVGAPGAATSVDQAGPSSHALLPEEAVLRARLFSAAAYARSVEAKPIREANDPPVSPD